jgi:tetratricopeptide (TPR) repeat protein
MSQGKWKEAEEPLTIVTKLAPDCADGYTTLGSLLYHLDRTEEAQRLFSRSIELKPTATAFSNRCAVGFDRRAMDLAVADCRKAAGLQPTSAIAWGNLGDALAELSRGTETTEAYRKAIAAGEKLLAINPVNPDLLALMAGFAVKTGQKQLAILLADRGLSQLALHRGKV